MGKGNEIKSALREFLDEFALPEDIADHATVQCIDEGGLVRMSVRKRIGFYGRCWNKISRAVLDMELGDTEPIREIERELAGIGVGLEFSSGNEDCKPGQPVRHLILLFRGKLTDKLK